MTTPEAGRSVYAYRVELAILFRSRRPPCYSRTIHRTPPGQFLYQARASPAGAGLGGSTILVVER